MDECNCVASSLSFGDLMRWLDWMEFMKGLSIGRLNELALVEPDDPDYPEAVRLLEEWVAWRAR